MATSKNFEVKNGLSVAGTERISSAGVGTFTDLNVTGTTTTIDTANLQVKDKNIVINYGSGDTSSTASGAGITIQDAVDASNDATLLWDASSDEFDFSHTVTAPTLTIAGAATFDTSTLVVDATNNRVGMGTASPAGDLHVVGASSNAGRIYLSDADEGTGAGDSLLITKSGSTSFIYDRDASSQLRLGAADDNDILTIDGSNARVGIGTTSPGTALQVGDGTGSPYITIDKSATGASGILLKNAGNNKIKLLANASEEFELHVNNALAMYVKESGNVGIGTTPDTHYTGYEALDIGNTLSLFSNNTGTNVSTLTNNGYLNSSASQWTYKVTDEATMYSQVHGDHRFSTAASGSADAAITWSEKFRITNGGKVFIGGSINTTSYSGLGDIVFQQSANDLGIGIINSGEDNTLKLINNGTVAKIEHNGAIPIQIKNANGVLAEFDTYAIPKMNFNFAKAATTYAGTSTTNDELGNGQGVLLLKQQISVRDGSKILIWYDTGQILNGNQGGSGQANSNAQIAIYVTTNSSAPPSRGKSHMINMQDTDHFMYPAGSMGFARFKMNGIGATDTISTGGTYYIYMYGGGYNSGSYTFNYQHSSTNSRGASIIWAEVIA